MSGSSVPRPNREGTPLAARFPVHCYDCFNRPSTIARVHATLLHIDGRGSTYDFNDLLKRQSEADEECLRLLGDRSCERGVVAVPEDVVDEFFLVRSADHRCATEQRNADSRPKSTGTSSS